MADRYWVGGTGTWDSTTTTNWSATSGGAGGASAPTSADNVIFNSASNATAYTVTMGTGAVCADLTMAGPASGNVTWAGTTALSIFGSMLLSATGITRTYTGTITFAATTTGKTITTNGVSLGSNNITFNGIGGGWTFGSAMTGNTMTLTNGTLSTGNFNLTLSDGFTSSNTNIRTFNLGSSTVTTAGPTRWSITTSTNMTLNAGTSTIACVYFDVSYLFCGGLTYYNLLFTSSGGVLDTNNTFNNITMTNSSAGTRSINFVGSQTINGVLTLTGSAQNQRIVMATGQNAVYSLGRSTQATITAASVSLQNVDFCDIIAAGNGGLPWSGTNLGDGGRNSNITFAAPKTVYWNTTAGASWWSNTPNFAATSGGATNVANCPLPQDTVIIDNTGINAGSTIGLLKLNANSSNFEPAPYPSINVTTTNAFTLTLESQQFYFGNVTLKSNVTVNLSSSAGSIMLGGPNTFDFGGASITGTGSVNVSYAGFSYTMVGNVTSSTATFRLSYGTLNLGSYTATFPTFNSSYSTTRALNFGSGGVTVTGTGTAWDCSTSTNLTTTPGTATISMTGATAKTFAGGGKTYPKLNQGGAGALNITGANTFTDITASTVPSTISFPANTTTTVYGFSVSGTAGNLATVNSTSAGTRATLSYAAGTINRNYLSIKDISATGGALWYAGANSTNGGNNLGWIFTAAPDLVTDVRLRSFTERGRD